MFDKNHYVPILKAKKGEFDAFQSLSPDNALKVTPLFQFPPQETDHEKNVPKKNMQVHLDDVCKKIAKLNMGGKKFFVDLFEVNWVLNVNGAHPVVYAFSQLRATGSAAIPVTGFDRDQAFNQACAEVIRQDGRGICFRLRRDDFVNIEELNASLEELIGVVGTVRKEVHLLLDFEYLSSADVARTVSLAELVIQNITSISDYATLTVAATGVLLTKLGPNQIHTLPRTELMLWSQLFRRQMKRLPSFGDYAVENPNTPDLNPRQTTYGGKIRYTLENELLVFKGTSFKRTPLGPIPMQFPILAERVAQHARFMGANYSVGDQRVADCAAKACGPGNQTTWVAASTSHHLTLVANQVANFV